ncbi:hypothetical protein [Haloferula sp. BvORR071]|uniref:hypothetical protein n=1 Tax=Haloferula sp. BvORR071 TaxID=1396141 RepID=UPI000696DE62|nr:hypothetical protein [Haloferula sp. BvORR071]
MTALLFLVFVAAMAGVVLWLVWRGLARRSAIIATVSLITWLAYVAVIGYSGVIRNTEMRPPGAVFLFAPVMLFLGLLAVGTLRAPVGPALPLSLLLSIQSFRVIVELFIHQLWHEGLVPAVLTFSGANVDIYVGATAPLVALISARSKHGPVIAIVWNVLGLLALANVVVRAVLTAPGPLNLIHAEVPNLMIGTFPFMFIPGFFVPLAVALHLSAMKLAFANAAGGAANKI